MATSSTNRLCDVSEKEVYLDKVNDGSIQEKNLIGHKDTEPSEW